jgi:hypothetical protein
LERNYEALQANRDVKRELAHDTTRKMRSTLLDTVHFLSMRMSAASGDKKRDNNISPYHLTLAAATPTQDDVPTTFLLTISQSTHR